MGSDDPNPAAGPKVKLFEYSDVQRWDAFLGPFLEFASIKSICASVPLFTIIIHKRLNIFHKACAHKWELTNCCVGEMTPAW